jgi:hypothetical protein
MKGPFEPDVVFGAQFGIPAPTLGAVEERSGRLPNNELYPVCPTCHMVLPVQLAHGCLPGDIISVVGARNAGKSNFNGVLVHEMEQRFSVETGFEYFQQTTFSTSRMNFVDSHELYWQRYGASLYGASGPIAVPQTPRMSIGSDLRFPLIYRIGKRRRRSLLPFTCVNRSADLVLYDRAGEDLVDAAAKAQFCDYLGASSAIVLLIDITQLEGVRDHLSTQIRAGLPPMDRTAITTLLGTIIETYERQFQLRPGQKIHTPLAITFSKCDLLRHVGEGIDPSSPLLRDSRHHQGYDNEDGRQLSDELKQRLDVWGARNLVHLASARFSNLRFFAVSALGESPGDRQRLRHLAPTRVADPMLWLLHLKGVLPRAHQGKAVAV